VHEHEQIPTRDEVNAMISEALQYGHYGTAARLRQMFKRLLSEERGQAAPAAVDPLALIWRRRDDPSGGPAA